MCRSVTCWDCGGVRTRELLFGGCRGGFAGFGLRLVLGIMCSEFLGRVDELEGSKHKLSARLAEAEETIESLNQKVASTEKTKHRLETELEDLQLGSTFGQDQNQDFLW